MHGRGHHERQHGGDIHSAESLGRACTFFGLVGLLGRGYHVPIESGLVIRMGSLHVAEPACWAVALCCEMLPGRLRMHGSFPGTKMCLCLRRHFADGHEMDVTLVEPGVRRLYLVFLSHIEKYSFEHEEQRLSVEPFALKLAQVGILCRRREPLKAAKGSDTMQAAGGKASFNNHQRATMQCHKVASLARRLAIDGR